MISGLFRRIAFAAIGISLPFSAGMAAIAQNSAFSAAQKSDLERASDALNAVHTMEGSFVQIGPEGQMDQGRFYIVKPGKMRFAYAAPNPTLIVCDGRWVAVENTKLNTVDRYALWTTPLNLILGNDLDLRDNTDIVGVEHRNDELVISARSHKGRVNGDLVLVFAEPTLSLKQWTVKDAQGLLTTVAISNVKSDSVLDPALFTITALPNAPGKPG
jgi:outer membrane lipoprotein-sorting protein